MADRRRWLARACIIIAFSGALAACDPEGPLQGSARIAQTRAPGVPVALRALEGAPAEVASRLASELSGAARAREIAIVGANGKPRFQINGFVTAYGVPGGTAIAWTWDIFDAASKRAQRVSGAETLRGSPADPWVALDKPALERVAARSMEDIAAFLAASPQPARQAGARPAERTRAEAL